MNMHWIDWSIIGLLLITISISAYTTRKYATSVAGFLSASRCGGRYLLGVAEGIASLGAISIIGKFEAFVLDWERPLFDTATQSGHPILSSSAFVLPLRRVAYSC